MFGLGFKALRALIDSGDAMKWHRAKLVPEMFKPGEVEVYDWVAQFVSKHHKLPKAETVGEVFSDFLMHPAIEPVSYYLEHLENRYYHKIIGDANVASQMILQENDTHWPKAMAITRDAVRAITQHQHRTRIMSVVKEAPKEVLVAYQEAQSPSSYGKYGWPHLDKSTAGILPGDFSTIVGRPASGKTWLTLFIALCNWQLGRRVLYVTTEMSTIAIAQRLVTMYAGTNISQLKVGGYATPTYKKFAAGLLKIAQEHDGLHIIDGNLSSSVEDVYTIASQLEVSEVVIDGAYLLRHPNSRLDRYTKVAENAEQMKLNTSILGMGTVASYQFSRTAVKGDKKGEKKESPGLEDIAFSDVIGQLSTVALGLMQEESVETLNSRLVRILKGRNGEMGQFKISWDFDVMNFNQWQEAAEPAQLEYI